MEIMLNKSYIGSWGMQSDVNIPHEIINMFKSDNGNLYIYVPPYGGFDTKQHEIDSILLTGPWNNNATEVFYFVSGLKLMHNGGKYATESERTELEDRIIEHNIAYGNKLLHEIPMSSAEEKRVFYLTFQADKIYRPKKRMFIAWNNKKNENSNDKTVIVLNEDYKYQRQIGYVKGDDYKKLKRYLTNDSLWDEEIVNTINPQNYRGKNHGISFIELIHKENDESIYTNLLYELFNHAPQLCNHFAREVLKIDEDDTYVARKEVPTRDKKGRIDLVIEGDNRIIIIENKIKSGLNGKDKYNELSQLTTYIESIEEQIEFEKLNVETHYYLISPDYNDIDIGSFDKKRGCEFIKVKYSQLYDFLLAHKAEIEETDIGNYTSDIINAFGLHSVNMRDVVEHRFVDAICR